MKRATLKILDKLKPGRPLKKIDITSPSEKNAIRFACDIVRSETKFGQGIIVERESKETIKLLVRCPGGGHLDFYGVLTFKGEEPEGA